MDYQDRLKDFIGYLEFKLENCSKRLVNNPFDNEVIKLM